MNSSRTLSSLRHLCSLGLPAEMLLPQFLTTLGEAVPIDVHTFVWHSETLHPQRVLTDSAAVREGMAQFQQFLAGLRVSRERFLTSKSATLAGTIDSLAANILGYIENEVRRPLGVPHEVLHFLPDVGGQPGSLSLWRGGSKGYTAAEKDFVKSACAYLGYALAAPTAVDAEAPTIEDGLCGVVLLDAHGMLLHADEVAERLLPLAANAPAGRDFRRDDGLATLWRRLCRDLNHLTAGRSGGPPRQSYRNAWGLFAFRASWLQRPGPGCPGTIAATVTMHVPRKVKLWRAIHALRLPPRQQEVALLFAEGCSQSDIATRLNISRTTVIDHIRRLYDRLEIPADRDALRQYLIDMAT